jgi:adenylate cyclase
MRSRFTLLRDKTPTLEELGMGIGICTGEAVVGNVGSRQMMNYTVIGNTPNTAKRLQENALAGQILIDAETYQACEDEIKAREVPPLNLKGRSGPVPAYEVLSVKPYEL